MTEAAGVAVHAWSTSAPLGQRASASMAQGEAHAIVAPNGSGKTAALASMANEARAAGHAVGWGGAWPEPAATAPAFWHWRTILRTQGIDAPGALEADLPAVAGRLLAGLADGALDLILLDDVDRADRASRVLLEAVIRQLPGLAVRLAVTSTSRSAVESLGLRSSHRPPLGPTTAATPVRASIAHRGEYWTVAFGGRLATVRDRKGLSYLTTLLERRGEEVHVLELAQDGVGGAGTPAADGVALAAYRREWRSLTDELDAATADNDVARAQAVRVRIDQLEHALVAAIGRNGRSRLVADAGERARVNVTRAIRSAIVRLEEAEPALGSHLHASIRTGSFCSYAPDASSRVAWDAIRR